MTASAHVVQMVRAHYAQDDSLFVSSAMALARASKVPSVRATILNTLQSSRNQQRPARSSFQSSEFRSLPQRPEQHQNPASGLLEQLDAVSFEELLADPGIQTILDELVIELEYREELAARKLRARNRLLFWGPPGNGKCLGIGTPVMRFDGSIVAVEAVAQGDTLMGPDGAPRRVLGTTRGTGPLYRVNPVKGEAWVCNDVHVLTVVDTDSGKVTDIDVQAYLAASTWFRERSKLFTPENGVDFAPGPELPVDPYFLGVWYGDGTKARDLRERLATVSISKPDPEIRELVHATAARYGAKVREHTSYNGCPTFAITMGCNGGVTPNVLLHQIRTLFGDGSALPFSYLTASRRDREQFLAGLLDTDGTDNCGGFEIVQRVRGFADGICFLARSLGLRATIRKKVVNGEDYWRVTLSGECSRLPLRIARKRAAPRQQIKRVNRTGFTIEPIGVGEYAGFELDGDGRFLLGDFTVTHNTSHAAALGSALGVPAYGVSLPRVISKYVGETGENLGKLFAGLREDSLIVFDEIDAIGSQRGRVETSAGKEQNSAVNTMLTLLDRCKKGVLVATTNRPDILDPALLRRFDEQVEFPAPSPEQMRALSKKLCEMYGVPVVDVGPCINFDEVAKRCETEARRIVMKEILAAEADEEGEPDATEKEV